MIMSAVTLTRGTTIPAQTDLEARNPVKGGGAVASAKLDLSEPDRADPDKLNAILWNALRPGRPMPAPVRSAYGTGATVTSASFSPPANALVAVMVVVGWNASPTGW